MVHLYTKKDKSNSHMWKHLITRRCYQESNACVEAECLCLTNDLRKNTDKRVLPSYTDLAKRNRSRWAYSYAQSNAPEQSFRLRTLFEGTAFLTMYWLWTTGASCPLYRLPYLPNRVAPTRRKRSVVVASTSRWRPWRQWRDVTRCVDVASSSRCRCVDVASSSRWRPWRQSAWRHSFCVTATRACYTSSFKAQARQHQYSSNSVCHHWHYFYVHHQSRYSRATTLATSANSNLQLAFWSIWQCSFSTPPSSWISRT